MSVLSIIQAYADAIAGGFTPSEAVGATAISMRESNLNPQAHCLNCFSGVQEDSRGMMQINVDAHPQYRSWNLYDPVTNYRAGAQLYHQSGWSPWREVPQQNVPKVLDAIKQNGGKLPPAGGGFGGPPGGPGAGQATPDSGPGSTSPADCFIKGPLGICFMSEYAWQTISGGAIVGTGIVGMLVTAALMARSVFGSQIAGTIITAAKALPGAGGIVANAASARASRPQPAAEPERRLQVVREGDRAMVRRSPGGATEAERARLRQRLEQEGAA